MIRLAPHTLAYVWGVSRAGCPGRPPKGRRRDAHGWRLRAAPKISDKGAGKKVES